MQWLNIELTSRCNKSCPFCGRAKARKDSTLLLGDMPIEMVNDIVMQFEGSIVQFNKDGEPLLYNNIWAVGQICRGFTTNIVTNGIMLMEKADALLDNFTSITVSVYEDDIEQFKTIKRFIEYKRKRLPLVYVKFLGDYYNPEFEELGIKAMRRTIHNPLGDTGYIGNKPPIPEVGVCLDFLYKPSIKWNGDVNICNRFDHAGRGVIGNVNDNTLEDIWNSPVRLEWLKMHQHGMRDAIPPCKSCEFWGYPANG